MQIYGGAFVVGKDARIKYMGETAYKKKTWLHCKMGTRFANDN